MTTRRDLPYSDIVVDLIESIVRAQTELVHAHQVGLTTDHVPSVFLNRHFAWLPIAIARGRDRHLFETTARTASLRKSVQVSSNVKKRLLSRESIFEGFNTFYEHWRSATPQPSSFVNVRKAPPDLPTLWEEQQSERQSEYTVAKDGTLAFWAQLLGLTDVKATSNSRAYERSTTIETICGHSDLPALQTAPTRISQLVRGSILRLGPLEVAPDDDDSLPDAVPGDSSRGLLIQSPFAIAMSYLTIPTWPGSLAYAEMPIRHCLFELFQSCPREWYNPDETPHSDTFSVPDVEAALSRIWTSLRPRKDSLGEDKISPKGRNTVDSVVRHYLAARGALAFWFQSPSAFFKYAARPFDRIKFEADFRFGRVPELSKLPDYAEVVNQIFGVPLALRGAETLFRGGLRFSAHKGLVVAVQGGPGTGKTSLALGLAGCLSPFGVNTAFFTAEEHAADLGSRLASLIPETIKRLSFFPKDQSFIRFQHFGEVELSAPMGGEGSEEGVASLGFLTAPEDTLADGGGQVDLPSFDPMGVMLAKLRAIAKGLKDDSDVHDQGEFAVPKLCRAVVVLDGLHDLIYRSVNADEEEEAESAHFFYALIDQIRELRALVVLTMGAQPRGDHLIDYLVDVSIELNQDHVTNFGVKPDRRLQLSKARNQLCSIGSHGFQVSSSKGVRFSPQIAYELDRMAQWKTRVPGTRRFRDVLARVMEYRTFSALVGRREFCGLQMLTRSNHSAVVFEGSHVFINGLGSGGKAALSLKLAISPVVSLARASAREDVSTEIVSVSSKVLVVSFLYPAEYYGNIIRRLEVLRHEEYGIPKDVERPRVEVIQLYPGYLKPNDLFNKIIWELEAGSKMGDPYNVVIIDGIHNVFLQFPELESYRLFWPQMYSALRVRPLVTITTHSLPVAWSDSRQLTTVRGGLDDGRSEALRHALAQKMDFHFEVEPVDRSDKNKLPGGAQGTEDLFRVRTVSSIGQTASSEHVLWSRSEMRLVEDPGVLLRTRSVKQKALGLG